MQEVQVSCSQLVRAFDATVGVSPMACLRQVRAQRMAWVLCCADLSIAAVAGSVGWTDANYASRCFHAFYGVSPTEFRREQFTAVTRGVKAVVTVEGCWA